MVVLWHFNVTAKTAGGEFTHQSVRRAAKAGKEPHVKWWRPRPCPLQSCCGDTDQILIISCMYEENDVTNVYETSVEFKVWVVV